MKLLLSHRFFWPDAPPYATMLRSIAGRLAADGHEVTVYSTQPSYHAGVDKSAPARARLDGFTVVRAPARREEKRNPAVRAYNLVSYVAGLRRHILAHPDYDVVTASTFPPIAAAAVAAGAARRIGARFIYHCMDIHPEVSLFSGQLRPGWLFRVLRNLDSRTCRRADALVVLSEDMAETLRHRPGNDRLRPHVINNFLLEDFGEGETGGPHLPADKFTVLFAGNIGNFQNLDTVITAARELTDISELQFWFVGEGAAKERLVQKAGLLLNRSVFFLPHQRPGVAQRLMGEASINLVSLTPDIYRVAYPSKTLSIISRGAPILAVVEPESELGRMVASECVGYVADPTGPGAIAAAARRAYDERGRGPELRANAERLHAARFAKDAILDRWCELVAALGTR